VCASPMTWRRSRRGAQAVRVRRSYTAHGGLGSPKSGRVQSVPMVEQVARSLAALGGRERFVGDADLVFAGDAGAHLDASALRHRYKAALGRAQLRPLRFHDLRHTFGTLAVRRAELTAVQSWMGHADIQTTMRYVHHRDRGGEARMLEEAFALTEAPASDSRPVR